jgi:hypothetical protein
VSLYSCINSSTTSKVKRKTNGHIIECSFCLSFRIVWRVHNSRFRSTGCRCLQNVPPQKSEAAYFSRTLSPSYQTARCHYPENHFINLNHQINLKPFVIWMLFFIFLPSHVASTLKIFGRIWFLFLPGQYGQDYIRMECKFSNLSRHRKKTQHNVSNRTEIF